MRLSSYTHTDQARLAQAVTVYARRLYGVATRTQQWLADRRSSRQLQSLDDHQLKDIGLGRGDVEREVARYRLWQ